MNRTIDPSVARRYAEAYVNVLEKSDCLGAGLDELRLMGETFEGSDQLQHFLGSPEIAREEKKELLARVFSPSGGRQKAQVGDEGMGLAKLLLEWGRVDHLKAIADQAAVVAREHQGVVLGTAATARPISSEVTEMLAKAVGKCLGKRVVLEHQIDPELLGGVRVTVGTTCLDGSVKGKLHKAHQELKQIKVN